MKGRILESQYIPDYNSFVMKETKYGTFAAETILREEDSDIDNSFDGCRISEYKCDLQAYKEKAKRLRERAIGVETAYKNIRQSESGDDLVMIKLDRQVEYAWREYHKAKEYYERMRDYLPMFIESLGKQRREMREKTEK